MKNYILNTSAGNTFDGVAKKAKEISEERNVTVEFEFNGITCLVTKDTNLDWLYKDYTNAFVMEWKTVTGIGEYSPSIQKELDRRKKLAEEKAELQRKEWEKKDNEQREQCEAAVNGIELEIIPEKLDEYKKYVEQNSNNGYSRAVIDYQENWAKLMQKQIANGKAVKECAEEAQKGLGFLGITGFQYGCAVQGLAHFWKHGEDLRKWHNKEYGVSEDKAGVVNPAVLTINV